MNREIEALTCRMARKERSRVTVVASYSDGSVEKKKIYVEEFVRSLEKGIEGKNGKRVYYRLGALPAGYVDSALDLVEENTFKVALKFPSGIRRYNYCGKKEFVIPQPEMLSLVDVRAGKLRDLFVYALNEGNLYHYPTANVYENGRVCLGFTERPRMESIKETERVLGYYYGTEFNNDLYYPGTTIIPKPEFTNHEGLLIALQELEEFPAEWLIPLGGKVEDVVNKFLA